MLGQPILQPQGLVEIVIATDRQLRKVTLRLVGDLRQQAGSGLRSPAGMHAARRRLRSKRGQIASTLSPEKHRSIAGCKRRERHRARIGRIARQQRIDLATFVPRLQVVCPAR